jgi:hypothetical protein
MAEATLTRIALADGMWEGWLARASGEPPRLRLRHRDDLVGEARAERGAGGWLVRFRLPADRLSDGVQTFVIEDEDTGEALHRETVIAGDEAAGDLRAEVDFLRAELDLLKRAFRAHCAERGAA